MMDDLNRAPVPEELISCPACRGVKGCHHQTEGCRLQRQEKEHLLADLEKAEDRMLDRLETAAAARRHSQQASQRSKIRTRPIMVPKLQPLSRGRGRR